MDEDGEPVVPVLWDEDPAILQVREGGRVQLQLWLQLRLRLRLRMSPC